MSPAWRRSQPIAFRPTITEQPLDTRFPRAIAGEDYQRYARAMWPQALRWLRKHLHRVTGDDQTLMMDDARDLLGSVASFDLARRLYPQEERLLTELLQTNWPTGGSASDAAAPATPSFIASRR